MLYLCPKHLHTIASDHVYAITLWHEAMENGTNAVNKADWTTARGCFGAAFETATLLLRDSTLQREFSLNHLINAGRELCAVLQRLELWEEAQLCLFTLQNRLLLKCKNEHKPNRTSPAQLLKQTQIYTDALIDWFNFADEKSSIDTQADQPQSTPAPSVDILIASTFYLMSRYASKPSEDIRAAIIDHLQKLRRKTTNQHNDTLNNTCHRLQRYWLRLDDNIKCLTSDSSQNEGHMNNERLH